MYKIIIQNGTFSSFSGSSGRAERLSFSDSLLDPILIGNPATSGTGH